MDASLKELERQGFKVGTEASQKIVFTTVKNDTDVIYLRLEEEGSINRTKSDSKWRNFDYDHYTNGKLRLRISAYRYTDWGLKVSDTNSKLIEEQSRRIFISIVETFEKAKERRLEFEKRNRRYAQERIERERIRKEEEAEQKKRNELETATESFTKSKYIYQFIKEIKSSKKQLELSPEEEIKFEKWITWANTHADRLNPVKQQIDRILSGEFDSTLKLID